MTEPLQLIHVSDIHFGSGEAHGPINSQTGLNIRFEDFVAALEKTVGYAIEIQADAFIFSGDAYTRIGNAEKDRLTIFAQLRRHSDFTLLGELDGVGNEIAQDLRDLAFIVV